MLALFRSRRLIASVTLRQTRSIRSIPRAIPRYIKQWNPTLHRPPLVEAKSPRDLPIEEWIKLRDANRISIPIDRSIPPTKRLKRFERTANFLSKRIAAVDNLVRLLRHADERGMSPTVNKELCSAYSTAKHSYSRLDRDLPARAWEILYNALHVHCRPRKEYLTVLENDLQSFGPKTTVGQRVRYLEELFQNGEEEKALEAWENDRSDRSKRVREWRHDYKPEHLELGAKLYALAGKTNRARQIMGQLFQLYPDWNPSVMMLVFRAHTSSGIEENYDVAKDIYSEIRKRMGKDLTIETYDVFFIGFLEARCLRHAKQVFRDMCKDGYLASSANAEDVEEVLRRLQFLYRLGTDISRMTSIALDAISALPVSYYGRIFGDWMKCAVVENAPEAAAQILDTMIHRGCEPESFHFNLLLSALLRTKETSKVLQAENIGWRMIEKARLEAITAERIPGRPTLHTAGKPNVSTLIRNESPYRVALGDDVPTVVPSASVTTFAIMMQYHAKSSQWEHVEYLARQLKEAGIRPNTPVMNVMLDSKCRQGQYSKAWGIYKSLTDYPRTYAIFPDGQSIRQLWKILRFALGERTLSTSERSHLPTPRALLAETVRWWEMCCKRPDAERFRQGLSGRSHGAIMGLIMHCFSYAHDLPGCLVALHVLRQKFDIFPDERASEILKRHIAWMDMRKVSKLIRTQHAHGGVYRRNSKIVERLFQSLLEQKVKNLDISGREASDMSEEEIGDMGLSLLSEFVRAAMQESYPPLFVEVMIDQAKDDVGVPDMSTGELKQASSTDGMKGSHSGEHRIR